MNSINSLSFSRIQYPLAFILSILIGIGSLPAQSRVDINPQLNNLLKPGKSQHILKFKENQGLRASTLFTAHKDAFGLTANDQMVNYSAETDALGFTTYRFQQYFKNIPVEFATVIVNEKDAQVKTLIGKVVPNVSINTTPAITMSSALQLALNHIHANSYMWQFPAAEQALKQQTGNPDTSYYPVGKLCILNEDIRFNSISFHLAWKFRVFAVSPLKHEDIYIDAHSGQVLQEYSLICTTDYLGTATTKYSGIRPIMTQKAGIPIIWEYYRLRETGRGGGIETYNNAKDVMPNLHNTDFTDDDNNWNNVNAAQDEVATDVHWGTEKIYDYYFNVHARNSWNNAGMKITNYVHYDNNMQNAFQSGSIMAYGDGDGVNTAPWTALDLVAHEFTHGVTAYTAALVYQGESGAINESFSDLFGMAVETQIKGADWKMGEEIYLNPGAYLRNISDPKSSPAPFPQPDTYGKTNWINTSNAWDNGGVHINSGVMNKWFYLLCEGGSSTNDKGDKYDVKPIGMDKAMKIVYRNLTQKLTSGATFQDARDGAIEAATDLFGDCAFEVIQTTNAWYAVGVGDPTIQIDSSHIKKASCDSSNGSIFIRVKGVQGTPEYLWSNGETTDLIENLAPGDYSVTVTDPNTTCTVDSTFTVEEDVNFTVFVFSTDVTTCGGNDGSATVVASGVTGTPDIVWSNGESTETINDLEKGWYYVTVTDTSTHCEVHDSVEVKEPQPLVTISGGGTRTYCQGDPPPDINLSAEVDFCDGCEFTWSTGETSQSITVNGSGSYTVFVQDSNGCSNSASTDVSLWERDCDDPDDPEWEVPVVAPQDPNDIVGPQGYGPPKYVAKSSNQPYTIHFENTPEFATAPALKVNIDAPFDPNIDMFTLRLGDFGFGNNVFSVPPNSAFYNTRLDLRDSLGILVDVTAGIDVPGHKAFWIFQSIDPVTGVEPNDPLKGFLPVNDSLTNNGEGFVSFTQKAKSSTNTGDTIHAMASIVFDINEPLPTNNWANVIDALPPVSTVNALPATTDSTHFVVSITGNDDANGSGVKLFSLYSSVNSGSFTRYADVAPDSTLVFTGIPGNNYRFFSIATDNVGNVEGMKNNPEATVQINLYRPVIEGNLTYENTFNTPLNNVKIYLARTNGVVVDSTFTNSSGHYVLTPFGEGYYFVRPVITKAWGGVNATDALLVMQHFVSLDTLQGLKQTVADVNASQSINTIDALLIAKRFTELINSFVTGDWAYTSDSLHFIDSTVVHNIQALCYGDVDGSYNPAGGKPTATVRLYNEGQISVNAGQEIDLPVFIHENFTMGALSLVLTYPDNLVEITAVTAKDENSTVVFSAQNGMLRIACYNPSGIAVDEGNAVLFLHLKASKLNSGMYVSFAVENESSLAFQTGKVKEQTNLYIPKLWIEVPQTYYLASNRPNPFTSTTTIEYALPKSGQVTLTVFNSLGEQVATLVNEVKPSGSYKVLFDGTHLNNGVYFSRIEIHGEGGDFSASMKMILLRK